MERTFKMTSRGFTVTNYKWKKGKGLFCEMWRGVWVKSAYTLSELLNGEAGPFIETTKEETP